MDSAAINEMREKFGHLISKEVVDRYGDPFDMNDIRNVVPSQRRVKNPNLTIAEEVALLALDIEMIQQLIAPLSIESLQRKMKEQRKTTESPGQYL